MRPLCSASGVEWREAWNKDEWKCGGKENLLLAGDGDDVVGIISGSGLCSIALLRNGVEVFCFPDFGGSTFGPAPRSRF
jgi:hypothetical protein